MTWTINGYDILINTPGALEPTWAAEAVGAAHRHQGSAGVEEYHLDGYTAPRVSITDFAVTAAVHAILAANIGKPVTVYDGSSTRTAIIERYVALRFGTGAYYQGSQLTLMTLGG